MVWDTLVSYRSMIHRFLLPERFIIPWLLRQATIVSAKLVCRHHSAAQARSHQSRKPCAIWAFQATHRPYRWVTVRIYHTGLPVYSTLLVIYNTHMCRRHVVNATISCPPSASRFSFGLSAHLLCWHLQKTSIHFQTHSFLTESKNGK